MPHDIVIRGGLVVDGTGRAAFPGDVAVDGDRITAVGRVDGAGRREIDAVIHSVQLASGEMIAPGRVNTASVILHH